MSKMPRGFTLLEVMLAIAIFSTLSFLASMVFSQASEQHQRAKKTADNFDAIQHTMLLFENDLMQYVPRKNRQTNQPFSAKKMARFSLPRHETQPCLSRPFSFSLPSTGMWTTARYTAR